MSATYVQLGMRHRVHAYHVMEATILVKVNALQNLTLAKTLILGLTLRKPNAIIDKSSRMANAKMLVTSAKPGTKLQGTAPNAMMDIP